MNLRSVLLTGIGALLIGGASFAILSETQQKPKQNPPTKPAAKPTQKPTAKPAQTKSPRKRKRLATTVEKTGTPEIAVSVNGSRDGVTREGLPLLIECSVYAQRGSEGAMVAELAKAGGHWGEMFSVEVRNSAGMTITGLTPKLLVKPVGSIKVDGTQAGWLAWSVEFQPSRRLPVGAYTARVVLDSSSAVAGWKGKAQSPPCGFEVKPSGAAMTVDETRMLAFSEVQILVYGGKNAEAIAACDRLIGIDAGDVNLYSMKGDALARSGKYAEAVAAFDQALKIVQPPEEGDVPEPPFALLEKRRVAAEKAKAGSQ